MSALPETRYTLEEYLELDARSDTRYEYFDGEIVDMAGATLNHNRISRNVLNSLTNRLENRPCEALPADMRLKVPVALPYRYPDVSVVCGEVRIEKMGEVELLLNPVLIVEVLSSTTANYDREGKFLAYQSIESFHEYLLIAQDTPHVTQYVRQADGLWLRRDVVGLEAELNLSSVGCTLSLAEMYRGVAFAE